MPSPPASARPPVGGVAVRLFVGGQVSTVPGPDGVTREREDYSGARCFTAAHAPFRAPYRLGAMTTLLDSGAFTDPPAKRLTPDGALARQLRWEARARALWAFPWWEATHLASYDLLIDETWVPGQGKVKRRWSVQDADRAVQATVDAAAYLTSQRTALAPRVLVLGVQGVDPVQYAECVAGVLAYATPADWIGLGGWCILGRQKSLLPSFWAALHLSLPLIAARGVRHVHLYGVLWRVPLGGLTWLADAYGLTVSCDSLAPILACTHKARRAADGYHGHGGLQRPYWRDNVAWWVDELANLRQTPYYAPPPGLRVEQTARQLSLLENAA